MGEAIEELLLARGRTRTLQAAAVAAGMKTLLEHGLDKVKRGEIALEDLQLAVMPGAGPAS